ncbi:hemolysin family protein [Borreliella burgdorferi]|uniref:hemolysin family protein n=1 Tax=Borreliella burgdorferi TaxID=139 RepID=UPI0001F238CC|nr:hemolysin family protein [Borreliella burgdorferi]ADQ29081.1 hemolysin, putative [Borreliella burgdorferi N40]PRQ91659.1 HlyC/CorC family transporter [Borreliella burgdorferi]PRR15147.1 HlyC/CorC family transporter [Borreliella burgdorferi]PRR28998.1 HlyC/CorC family transporter [Borreliella burgdorferi]PRR41244.1 HlyC/CorC family transporter [Borreliella burgdorferi]
MLELIIILLFIILSAIFSASETAYTSLSIIQIQDIRKKGKSGISVYNLVQSPSKLITTILIGNNISNIVASTLTTKFVLEKYGNSALAISTGLITIIVLIFAEILPKQIAILNNEIIALSTSFFLKPLIFIFTPLIYIINKIIKKILNLFKVKTSSQMTKESIKNMLSLAGSLGILKNDSRIFMQKMLDIDQVRASEIMTHRTGVFSLSSSSKLKDVIKLIKEEGYSRIPIYKGQSREQIIGILIAKDLIEVNKKDMNKNVSQFIKPAVFVQQNKRIKDILDIMRKKQKIMAIVIDEYGGFSGILTIEDIVEKIFGAISDEYDIKEEKPLITQINDNTYSILGETTFDEIEEAIGISIKHKEYTNTIGGYLIDLLDKIPTKNETVKTKDGEYFIKEIQNNKIETITFIKSKK